jgi:hypothetical protein
MGRAGAGREGWWAQGGREGGAGGPSPPISGRADPAESSSAVAMRQAKGSGAAAASAAALGPSPAAAREMAAAAAPPSAAGPPSPPPPPLPPPPCLTLSLHCAAVPPSHPPAACRIAAGGGSGARMGAGRSWRRRPHPPRPRRLAVASALRIYGGRCRLEGATAAYLAAICCGQHVRGTGRAPSHACLRNALLRRALGGPNVSCRPLPHALTLHTRLVAMPRPITGPRGGVRRSCWQVATPADLTRPFCRNVLLLKVSRWVEEQYARRLHRLRPPKATPGDSRSFNLPNSSLRRG